MKHTKNWWEIIERRQSCRYRVFFPSHFWECWWQWNVWMTDWMAWCLWVLVAVGSRSGMGDCSSLGQIKTYWLLNYEQNMMKQLLMSKLMRREIGVRCLTTRNWNEFIVSADSWLIVNEWQRTNNSNSKQNISSWNMQWMTFHFIF